MNKILLDMKTLWILLLSAMLLSSCENEGRLCCGKGDGDDEITGTWLLYETGYSPGAGYIIEEVPPYPAKTLTLDGSGGVKSSIGELTKYKYYEILHDTNIESDIVAFFETKPLATPDIDNLEHSYNITFDEEHNMKLGFRYCFEGCHLGLRKVK
jgi:hypothetical protein